MEGSVSPRRAWRVVGVREHIEGYGHGGGRCVAGEEEEGHGGESEGKIDHTQILGGRIRLQVGISPSKHTLAYFKESKNCNNKIQNR